MSYPSLKYPSNRVIGMQYRNSLNYVDREHFLWFVKLSLKFQCFLIGSFVKHTHTRNFHESKEDGRGEREGCALSKQKPH